MLKIVLISYLHGYVVSIQRGIKVRYYNPTHASQKRLNDVMNPIKPWVHLSTYPIIGFRFGGGNA